MSAHDWKRIKDVFHEALRYEAGEQRSQFLDRTCGQDVGMRVEVESLFNSLAEAQNFLERPAITMPSTVPASPVLDGGRQISHYKIISHVATGGMGEVYLAEDLKLRRRVALKVLNDRIDTTAEQLRRFEREATVVSSLNHPNVLTIFDIDFESNIHLFATEFIQGVTLRQRIEDGDLSTDEAVGIVIQILSALKAAHEAGIVHRDIKPENIMIRDDGIVKVLDFGVAKVTKPEQVDGKAITWEQIFSRPGVIMGTAAYMSPEQARGKRLDARTDIFSAGVVLYELLTGRPPFRGQTATDIIAALIQDEVAPPSRKNPEVSPRLDDILAKMLEKDRESRYPNAADVLIDLRNLAPGDIFHRSDAPLMNETASGTEPAASEKRHAGTVAMIIAAVVFILLIAYFFGF